MLTTVARIETPTTLVEIMEGSWPQPVELTWNDPRPVITLLLRGVSYKAEGRFRNTGGNQALERIGSVFFVPPNHELYGWGSGGRVRAARCVFDPAYYQRTAGDSARLTAAQLSRGLDIRGSFATLLLTRLMREALSPGFAAGILADSLGAAVLLEGLGQARGGRLDAPAQGSGLTLRQKRIIDDYLQELEHNAALNPPNATALAARCGLGVRHFSRLFQQEYGESAGRFFNTLQIERAQRLLTETDLPLKKIAFQLGFSNAANFSTAFSAACHLPPAAYRRRHQD